MQRENFFKIFFIAAFAGIGFLLYSGWKSLDSATLAVGYERAVPLLRKYGINFPNALDKSAGFCIPVVMKAGSEELVEVENEPFSYATALKLELSEPRTKLLCMFKATGVGFTVTPTSAAIITIYREPGKPGILELKSGVVSITSQKLDVLLRLPSSNVQLKTEKMAKLLISVDQTGSSVGVLQGTVEAQIENASRPKAQNVFVTFYSSEGARLSVNNSPAFSKELEARWQPSGLTFNYNTSH